MPNLPNTRAFFPSLSSLDPGQKSFKAGTHRSVTPSETVARTRPLMPVMGITRVANVTGLDCIGIPVVMVCRPNSRSLTVSQGKGLDLASAQASGLMESIELYHGEHITLPVKLCSFEELRYTHSMVNPAELPRLRGSVFDAHQRMLWIEGHDLIHDESIWLPHEVVHMDFTLGQYSRIQTFAASSNGLASGNHLLEAVSHAICEVVERDAYSLWLLLPEKHQHQTRIDLHQITSVDCQRLLDQIESANLDVLAWNITSDVGIPAFHCTLAERTGNLYPASGIGCHPDPSIALLRALTEAAQSRLTAIAGSRDDLFRNRYAGFQDPDMASRYRAAASLTPPSAALPAGVTDHSTFAQDVHWELQRLQAVGIDRVIIVDLTKTEFRIPVVRIVIPGLEFVMGRPGYALGTRAVRLRERTA